MDDFKVDVDDTFVYIGEGIKIKVFFVDRIVSVVNVITNDIYDYSLYRFRTMIKNGVILRV